MGWWGHLMVDLHPLLPAGLHALGHIMSSVGCPPFPSVTCLYPSVAGHYGLECVHSLTNVRQHVQLPALPPGTGPRGLEGLCRHCDYLLPDSPRWVKWSNLGIVALTSESCSIYALLIFKLHSVRWVFEPKILVKSLTVHFRDRVIQVFVHNIWKKRQIRITFCHSKF